MTKRILAFILVAFSVVTLNAFSVVPTSEKNPLASEVMVPIGKTGKMISLADLATISPKNFSVLTGKKLNLSEKIGFKLSQRQIKKCINGDGTVNAKLLAKFNKKADGGGFHLGGFALGFFLGLIGVLIAYVAFNDDLKSQRIKWAWLGVLGAIVLSLILVLAVFNSAK
jgi:hypothetical protein